MDESFYTRFRLRTRGNRLFWMAVLFCLGIIFSYFVFISPDEGGDATFLSMAFVALIGYIYGPVYGFTSSILFGFVMLLLHGQVPTQDVIPSYMFKIRGVDCYMGEVVDYILGYGLLGVTGFFSPRRDDNGIKDFSSKTRFVQGFALAAGLRFIEGIWNCYYFYDLNRGSFLKDLQYSTWYSFWYIGLEAVLTIIIILLPPVAESIRYVAECATTPYRDNTNYL